MSGVHWGDVPTWVGAVGTVGTLVGGLLLLKREADRDEERHAEARRRQASRVTAWREDIGRPVVTAPDPSAVKTRHDSNAAAKVHNASDQPIFHAVVELIDRNAVGLDPRPPDHREHFGTIEPGGRREVPFPATMTDRARGVVVGRVTFMDSNGRRWSRDTNGVLEELPVIGPT